MRPACSRALDSEDAQPYFLWDQPITVGALKERLRIGDAAERAEWASRILREARFDDVWRFLSLNDVLQLWPSLASRLGRRRAFWTWMLDRWRADGLIP